LAIVVKLAEVIISTMQYVIFHGAYGSANGNWFPWLKSKLESQGHEVFVPQYPEEDYEEVLAGVKRDGTFKFEKFTLNSWLNTFKTEVYPKLKDNPVFIGHSIGPLFILHILSTFDIKIKKAYFIAPFLRLPEDDPPYDLVIRAFNADKLDFEAIKEKIAESLVIYSDNDPGVPIPNALEYAKALGSKTMLISGMGHFNAGSGITEFPRLLELLKEGNS
jgi:hypothetical protein